MVFEAFAVATAVVMGVSAVAALREMRVYGDALAASVLLSVLLGVSVLCRIEAPPGGMGNMIWLSLADLVALMITAYWFMTRPAPWKFVLSFTFIAQLCAHAGFWRGWFSGSDTRYAYILCLNLLAVVQLVAVGWPGASYVARGVRGRLSNAGGRRVHGSHGAAR
ncbi:hypothetical protein [Caulobacter segnis]